MDFIEPKPKNKCTIKKQPAFPIFIESELGITIDNWVHIVYTGVFNGYSVQVTAPEEISALYSMGNFGKGSLSRSRPIIMRNNSDIPQFIRQRQYVERKKWTTEDTPPIKTELPDQDDVLTNLTESIKKVNESLNKVSKTKNASVIDLSSDEDCKNDIILVDSPSTSTATCTTSSKNKSSSKVSKKGNKNNESKSLNSVVVLPDSDSGDDDYFSNLHPKLYNDNSSLQENLMLSLQEAYFLAYGLGCLQILDQEQKAMNLNESWKKFCKCEKDFATKYIVYHYYRSKGWVVKTGIKFGGQYLLYKEGQSFYHATYIVLIEVVENFKNHKSKYDWTTVLGIMRMATTAVKEVIIAQVCVPADTPLSKLQENPINISKFKVHEVLLRRWQSKQERNEEEEQGK